MIVRVPHTMRRLNPGHGGMGYLGDVVCDEANNCVDTGSSSAGDTSTNSSGIETGSFPGGGSYSCDSSGCDITPAGGSSGSTSQASTPQSTSGITASQLANIIALAGNSATKALQISQGPSLIPGTSLVYNPATGAIVPASGVTQAATTAISQLSSLAVPLVVLVVAMTFLGGKR